MNYNLRKVLAARAAVVALFAGLVSSACGQASMTVAPSAGSSGGARTERKVGDPIAPPCDATNPCTTISGNVTFTGPSVSFSAGTMGQADVSDPTWFKAHTVFAVRPQGRLSDSAIAVSLAVSADLAHVTVFRNVGEPNEEQMAGVAVPQIMTVADASCASSGQRLDTQFTVNIEKFGKTTVSHRHCR